MNEQIVFILNVGNSDIRFKQDASITILDRTYNDFIFNRSKGCPRNTMDTLEGSKAPNNFRELTEYMFKDFNQYRESVEFPIVDSLLEYVKSKDNKIHSIYLFASDQVSKHGTDTIYVAEMLKIYIQSHLKERREWKECFNELKAPILVRVDKNPADIDQIYELYKKEISERIYRTHEQAKIYISITGGTPAMNNVLLLQSLYFYKDKLEVLYLPRSSNVPLTLDIDKRMVRENIIETLRSNVAHYDYYAAYEDLNRHATKFANQKKVDSCIQLLSIAHNRLSFNFKAAYQAIHPVLSQEVHHRDELQQISSDLNALINDVSNRESLYLQELIWNMKILYERGQFIDFLGRAFRFEEEVLTFLAVDKCGVVIDNNSKLDTHWLKSNQELANDLSSKKIGTNGKVNRRLLRTVLGFYTRTKKEFKFRKMNEILQKMDFLNDLSGLRNASPLAHGFSGISEDEILEKVSPKLSVTDKSELQSRLFGRLSEIYSDLFGLELKMGERIYHPIHPVLNKLLDELL